MRQAEAARACECGVGAGETASSRSPHGLESSHSCSFVKETRALSGRARARIYYSVRSAKGNGKTKCYKMEWDEAKCIKLIDEFRNKDVLWNSQNSAYHNKVKKEDAWRELSEIVGKSAEELKRKMESLKGSYRREKARIRKSMARGKGRNAIYSSKWFAFDVLKFLDDRNEPRKTPISNFQTASEDEETSNDTLNNSIGEKREIRSQSEEELDDQNASTSQEPGYEHQNKKFKSRKQGAMKRKKDDEENSIITEAFEYLQEEIAASKKQKDQCSLFGEYIADKLRTFDLRTRAVAQHRISNVLFELEMDIYQ